MKYLSKRDDFLRVSKINEKNDFIRKSKSGLQAYELITEDGGPFYNTVGFYDSAIGNWFDSLRMKLMTSIGKARIQPVLKRLYKEFDRIVAEGILAKADNTMKIDAFRLMISIFLEAITVSIEKGEDYPEVLSLTQEAIDFIEDEIDVEFIPEKDKLLQELEGLKKILEELGVEAKVPTEEEGQEEEQEEEKENEVSTGNIDSLYPMMVQNLKSLSTILKINSKVEPKNMGAVVAPNANKPEEVNKPMNTIKSAETIKDSFIFEATTPQGELSDENIKQAISKLKSSITNLGDPKIKIAVNAQLIDSILAQGDQYKDEIIKLYTEINNFLFGVKSKTLNYTPDKLYELYKGPGKNLIGNNVDPIAEKIAKFYKRASQFENADLFTKIGEIGTPLKSFVDTLKKINASIKPGEKVTQKPTTIEEPKKEARLMGFSSFMKVNEEVEEPVQGEKPVKNAQPGGLPMGSISEKVKDFFDSKCKTTKKYILDKTEAEKIEANFEKLGDDSKKGNFIISGLDPVINIIRLFNRAYKIFTVSTISKRKDGKVSSRIWARYTSYGGRSSSEPNGWAGPFRDNKIFNIWEDGVHKLMADPKYQFIFLPKTELRIPNVPNPQKPEDYDYRPNMGNKLAEFMEDILDGEEMYKISGSGTEKGVQSKFIKTYFGAPDTKTEEGLGKETSFTIDKDDAKSNSDNSNAIANGALILKFKKALNKEIKANQFFVVNCKTINDKGEESKNATYRFFHITEVAKNGFTYLSMCNSFFYFDGYLKSAPNSEQKEGEPVDGRKKTIEKGDLEKLVIQSKFETDDKKFLSYMVKYTSTKTELINSLLTSGNKFEITHINKDKKAESEKIKVIAGYWLVDDKSLPYTAYLSKEYLGTKITGGSNSVKDGPTLLKNSNNTSIKKI